MAYQTQWTEAELAFPGELRQGAKGDGVKRVQEWICLMELPGVGKVKIDGDFGPATEHTVRAIQKWRLLPETGKVDGDLWKVLVNPLQASLAMPTSSIEDFGSAVDQVSERYLGQHPMEVGGQNQGPWVRAFMDGHEGQAWAWCAGFAGFLLRHAKHLANDTTTNVGPRTFSCDVLAEDFRRRGRLIAQAKPADVKARVKASDLFFVVSPTSPSDRTHVGVVLEVLGDGSVVRTIEGNTNDEGSREGYEVCERMRAVGKLDFALVR